MAGNLAILFMAVTSEQRTLFSKGPYMLSERVSECRGLDRACSVVAMINVPASVEHLQRATLVLN